MATGDLDSWPLATPLVLGDEVGMGMQETFLVQQGLCTVCALGWMGDGEEAPVSAAAQEDFW